MILERIYTLRGSISRKNSTFSIDAECETNTTDLQQADLDAKFKEEESWLGIGVYQHDVHIYRQ